MKRERKEKLLHCFPELPYDMENALNVRKTPINLCIFLSSPYRSGEELFVRCYHRFYDGHSEERYRYVFAKDGCTAYKANGESWKIMPSVSEPVLDRSYCNRNDSYFVANFDSIFDTCMEFSGCEYLSQYFAENRLFQYLKLWQKHHNAEYLVKTGYDWLIFGHDSAVDWTSENLLKMLRLNRTEFKLLQGKEKKYLKYIKFREHYPEYNPEELMKFAEYFGINMFSSLAGSIRKTGLTIRQIYNYLAPDISAIDYFDYIDECERLGYNLHDSMINRPKCFLAMHERTASLMEYQQTLTARAEFQKHYEERKKLEFRSGKLLICQPKHISDIISEGNMLHHCVGGYAERHAKGKLHILFIRQDSAPDISYYTMEISTSGRIVQVRGDHNERPTPEVAALVEEYKMYLEKIFVKERTNT